MPWYPSAMRRLTPALLLAIILNTSACGSAMNEPDIKQNPHPRQRYELIATVDAPGAFESVHGYAYYQVSNPSCVPKAPLTGGRNLPNISHNFELTRSEDGSYRGYFYLDQFQNEDYFGLGVCQMDLMSVEPVFVVHGQNFITALMLEDVQKQGATTRLFKKESYANQSINNANAGSALNWAATDDDVTENPEAFFPMTVSIREAKP